MNEFEQIIAFREFMKKHYPENKMEFGDIHLEKFVEEMENPLLSDEDYQFLNCLYFSSPEAVLISKDCLDYVEFESYGEVLLTVKCKPTMFRSLSVRKEYSLASLMARYKMEVKNENLC